jgi:hypothetical protein
MCVNGGKATNRRAAAVLKHGHAKFEGFFPRGLHQRADALLDDLGMQFFLRASHAILCTGIFVHQAIKILQGLDPPGYPAVDGVKFLETILGKFGDPPCEELDIGAGGIVVDWFPRIVGLCCYVLEGTKAKHLLRGSFILHVEP